MAYAVLVRLEWDDAKNFANQEKHGVSFEEAAHLFTDEVDCLEIFDVLHSDEEERFISIGPVERGLILVVWTERLDDVVRIISARWTTKSELSVTERTWDEIHDRRNAGAHGRGFCQRHSRASAQAADQGTI